MGLDTVELVMEIEEAFGVSIPDCDGERIQTVGQLHKYLLARLRSTVTCPTARAFYLLRRMLIESVGIERRDARPTTPLADLLPAPERRAFWRQVAGHPDLSGWRLPALRLPTGIRWAFWGLLAREIGWASVVFGLEWIWLIAFAAVAVWLVAWRVLAGLAREFPASIRSLGDLARELASAEALPREQPAADLSEAEVWRILTKIVVEQLGVAPELVTPEASFVGDLGCE